MAQLQIFLSYAPADSAVAETVVKALRGAGADVWFVERNQGMPQPLEEITHQLHERLVFIVLLSEKALASEWVRNECRYVFNLQIRFPSHIILPVAIAPLKPNTFDNLPYLAQFKRIEGPNYTHYSEAEMLEHLLHFLALTPTDQIPITLMSEPGKSVNDLLTWGRVLAAQKRWAEALSFFQRATERDPNNAAVWGELGRALNGSQRYSEALIAHNRSLALNSQLAWVWKNKGFALDNLGRQEEALVAYDNALALDPNYIDAWDNKGYVLLGLERYEEALVAYDRTLALDPGRIDAWKDKGYVLISLGQREEALAVYDRVLLLNPDDAVVQFTKGNILSELGRYDEALAAYDCNLVLDHNHATGWITKGNLLYALERRE